MVDIWIRSGVTGMTRRCRAGSDRTPVGVLAGVVGVWAMVFGGLTTVVAPPARPDVQGDKELSYIVQIFMRPGSYGFANPSDALAYGYGICGKLSQGRGYPELITDVQGDLNSGDNYHASYLIDRAVNELCPELIWQLRNSAAGYRPPASAP